MDPITRASKTFLREAAAHWKARRGHVLFLVTEASSRGDLVKTLRLAEQSPTCRRPLFLFEEAFEDPQSYFELLAKSLVDDYKAIQKGAAEEGVSLSDLEDSPNMGESHASGRVLCGHRARSIGRALEGKLEGIDVALVPRQVTAAAAFREVVLALAAELRDTGARLLVLALDSGPLSDEAEGRAAHFHVDADELADYLKNLGNSASEGPPVPAPHPPLAAIPPPLVASPGAESPKEGNDANMPDGVASKELRALLLSAAQATRKGHHEEARRLFESAREACSAHKWALGEAVTWVALAGAHLAAGAPDSAVESYQSAFMLATRSKAYSLAAQAALGEGAVRMQQKRYLPAMRAYAVAADAADLARAPMLEEEARRMARTAAALCGAAPPTETPPSPVAPRSDEAWTTGPVDLSRLSLPILPFDPEKKP